MIPRQKWKQRCFLFFQPWAASSTRHRNPIHLQSESSWERMSKREKKESKREREREKIPSSHWVCGPPVKKRKISSPWSLFGFVRPVVNPWTPPPKCVPGTISLIPSEEMKRRRRRRKKVSRRREGESDSFFLCEYVYRYRSRSGIAWFLCEEEKEKEIK